jgi:hypothetical protein
MYRDLKTPGDEERESREGVEAEQEQQQPKWVGYRRLLKRVSMGEFIFLGVWLLTLLGSTTSNEDEAKTSKDKLSSRYARQDTTRQDIQRVGT